MWFYRARLGAEAGSWRYRGGGARGEAVGLDAVGAGMYANSLSATNSFGDSVHESGGTGQRDCAASDAGRGGAG
jgi:hypothetical protein